MWLIYEDESGEWQAKNVGPIGDPEKLRLPVANSLSADDKTMFMDTFSDGKCRVYDVSNPFELKLIHEQVIGKQLNMVSQSWDGERVYFTSSLLANGDKKGEDNEQFIKGYSWDGKELSQKFAIDFTDAELGRPHLMRFGAHSLY